MLFDVKLYKTPMFVLCVWLGHCFDLFSMEVFSDLKFVAKNISVCASVGRFALYSKRVLFVSIYWCCGLIHYNHYIVEMPQSIDSFQCVWV